MKRVILLCVMVFSAAPALLAAGRWVKVEMTDFTLVGTADEKQMKSLGIKLEQYRSTLAALFPGAKLSSSLPTTIYLFSSYDDFQSYFSSARFPTKPAGIFITTGEGNLISLSAEKRGLDVDDIIFHEYFHYVLSTNFGRVPLWINEGMAEYFSTFETDETGAVVKLGTPPVKRLADLRSRQFMPFEKLFAVDGRSPEYHERNRVGVFYGESWALVHYFLNSGDEKKKAQFFNFINLLNSHQDPKTAFGKAFGADYGKLESDLQNYISRFAFNVATFKFGQSVDWEKTAKVSTLTETEAKALQGNFLRYVNGSDAAKKKLLEAIALDAKSADSYRMLGAIYESEKNIPEARENYEKALALDPNNYLNYESSGRLSRTDKNYEQAVKYYQQAIKLKPDAARAYTALGFIYESLGRNDEALAAHSHALQLNPAAPDNFYNLANAAFAMHNNDVAQAAATSAIEMIGWFHNYSIKSALILYFTYQREKKTGEAAAVLKLGMDNVKKDNFYSLVFRYLNKEIDDRKLFSSAADVNDKTIADCYIGMNLLIQGKPEEAKEKFRWIRDNGNREFSEYKYAVYELRLLSATE